MIAKPWTFEPYESYTEQTWEIYDPNLARIVAVFFDSDEAQNYLDWRNKKQAKEQAKKEAKDG